MATNPLTPNDLGYTIRKLQDQIASQEARIQELQNSGGGLGQLANAISEQSARLEEFTRAVSHGLLAGGEDIPGPRMPRVYTVSISLTSGSTASASGEAIITNDGPFKCFGMAAYYIPSSVTDPGALAGTIGRFLPVSTSQLLVSAGASGGTIAGATIDAQLFAATPDLSFKIEVAGSGRSWTPNVTAVPGGVFFGIAGYNKFEQPALVAGGERLVVTAYPERAMANTGTCRVVFEGYQILTNQPVRY